MIKLVIDNSLSRIEGLSAAQFKELKELLSYNLTPQATFFGGGHRSGKRYLISARGEFPTGLGYIVAQYLSNKTYNEVDNRKRPAPKQDMFGGTFLPKEGVAYPEQIEAAKMAVLHQRGVISMPTGSGKSFVIGLIINALKLPTLVVVPSLELKRQLQASIKQWFGHQQHIRVENVDALDPNIAENADVVIVDEFHHAAAKTYRKLNQKAWKNVFYRFGVTATPFRADENERLLLESFLSKVIYRLDYKTAVDKGYIVPIEAYYYDLPKTPMKGNDRIWSAVYSEKIVNNKVRNDLIAQTILTLHDKATLCLVKEIKHGEIISDSTGVAFANGQADNTRELTLEFNLQERTQLIGTVGVLGEGIDSKPAEYVILAGGGKAKTQFMQNVGRIVRTYPGKESGKVILFRDASNKYLLKHFNAQVKYLKEEYGVTPIKISV